MSTISMHSSQSMSVTSIYSSLSPPEESPPSLPSGPTSFFDHGSLSKRRPAFPAISMPAWFSKASNSSASYGSPHLVRISEPMIGSALDNLGPNQRFKTAISRKLGKGAQVVRTPDEALAHVRSS